MRKLSATLGINESNTTSITLDATTKIPDLSAIPLAPKEESKLPRVKRSELEFAYLYDGTAFNAINASVQLIMSAEHPVIAENPRVQEFFDNFLEGIGKTGNPKAWDDLLSTLFRYQMIYGDVLVEKIFNKKRNRITDLDIIDPKRHDLFSDNHNKAVVDEWGRPLGYVVHVSPYTDRSRVTRVDVPGGIKLKRDQYFLPPKHVAPFKLFEVGDGLRGIGLIEPVYKTIVRKLNLQDAQANAAWRHSTPIIHAEIGDMDHEPVPQDIDNILDQLKKLRNNFEVAFPYFVKLHMIESKEPQAIREHLEYMEDVQVSGMGVPKAFATASGEATNRATLGVQSDLYELTLQDIARRTADGIQKFIFRPICELEGFDEVPRIEWGPIGIDRRERQANLMINLVKEGVISVEEARTGLNQLHLLRGEPGDIPPPPPKSQGDVGRPPANRTTEEKEPEQ